MELMSLDEVFNTNTVVSLAGERAYARGVGYHADRRVEPSDVTRDRARAVVRGPFLRPFPGGLYPGATEYDRDSVVYYPYSPEWVGPAAIDQENHSIMATLGLRF